MTLALRHAAVPDSPLGRWDPRWKLAAVVVLLAGVAVVRTPAAAGVALLAGLLLTRLGRLPARRAFARLGWLAAATVPFLVLLPFTVEPAGPGWDIGPLHASRAGLVAAAAIALRCLAAGAVALVLAGTAPPHRTFAAAHALGVPGLLVQITQLAYRYIFLLADEARRVRVAMRTRGFRPGTNRHTYRSLGNLVGAVLVRGGDRADRVAAAMTCRGYDGRLRTLHPFRTTAADVLGFAAAVVGTIALVVADRSDF